MMENQNGERPHWKALEKLGTNDPNAIAARAVIECMETRFEDTSRILNEIYKTLCIIKNQKGS
jgi:hypothetical protein